MSETRRPNLGAEPFRSLPGKLKGDLGRKFTTWKRARMERTFEAVLHPHVMRLDPLLRAMPAAITNALETGLVVGNIQHFHRRFIELGISIYNVVQYNNFIANTNIMYCHMGNPDYRSVREPYDEAVKLALLKMPMSWI